MGNGVLSLASRLSAGGGGISSSIICDKRSKPNSTDDSSLSGALSVLPHQVILDSRNSGASKNHFEESFMSQVLLMEFGRFKSFGYLPSFAHGREFLTSAANIDLSRVFVVFISHRWISEEITEGQQQLEPDDDSNGKFRLIVEGVERIWALHAHGLEFCYLWIDYSCLQKSNPSILSPNYLQRVISFCDVMFTPILLTPCSAISSTPRSSSSGGGVQRRDSATNLTRRGSSMRMTGSFRVRNNPFLTSRDVASTLGSYFSSEEAYNGDEKQSYLQRGWCRLEMLLSCALPLRPYHRYGEIRFFRFSEKIRGVFMCNRRPHFLYSWKDSRQGGMPTLLPLVEIGYFDRFKPYEGHFSVEADRRNVADLVYSLHLDEFFLQQKTVGFKGSRDSYGRRKGTGSELFLNGDVIEGYFRDDALNGHGKWRTFDGFSYEGEFASGCFNGSGKLFFPNGDMYEGEFLHGHFFGQGVVSYADGSFYKGAFVESRQDGHGIMTYSNGDIYGGKWYNGSRHGNGTMIYASGEVYDGYWVAGVKQGMGRLVRVDGTTYVGWFFDDQMHGMGRMYLDRDFNDVTRCCLTEFVDDSKGASASGGSRTSSLVLPLQDTVVTGRRTAELSPDSDALMGRRRHSLAETKLAEDKIRRIRASLVRYDAPVAGAAAVNPRAHAQGAQTIARSAPAVIISQGSWEYGEFVREGISHQEPFSLLPMAGLVSEDLLSSVTGELLSSLGGGVGGQDAAVAAGEIGTSTLGTGGGESSMLQDEQRLLEMFITNPRFTDL